MASAARRDPPRRSRAGRSDHLDDRLGDHRTGSRPDGVRRRPRRRARPRSRRDLLLPRSARRGRVRDRGGHLAARRPACDRSRTPGRSQPHRRPAVRGGLRTARARRHRTRRRPCGRDGAIGRNGPRRRGGDRFVVDLDAPDRSHGHQPAGDAHEPVPACRPTRRRSRRSRVLRAVPVRARAARQARHGRAHEARGRPRLDAARTDRAGDRRCRIGMAPRGGRLDVAAGPRAGVRVVDASSCRSRFGAQVGSTRPTPRPV